LVSEIPELVAEIPKPVAEIPKPVAEIPKPIRKIPAPQVPEKFVIPQPGVLEEADIRIIGQIKKLNGIVAISVFNNERNILLMGDIEIDPLLTIARTMLATAHTITPLLDWGSFVHTTLQIPDGNVIIAPYHENHLCILTTKTINIGHIRRILRDLQQDRNSGTIV
jgi:predicted regulator of Ras-like GTPase activity (Roadblock/LC7/MglB family)